MMTAPHIPEANMRRLVSKVVESTRCTPGEAEHVLRENANDPNLAALAILERSEDRETWKESKSKKTKKQDVVVNEREENRDRRQNRGRGRDNQHNFRSQRGGDSQRDGGPQLGGGVYAGAGQVSGEGRRDKGPHHFDGHTNRGGERAAGGEKSGRGGGGGYKGARDGGRSQQYNGGGAYRNSKRTEKNDMGMEPVDNEHGELPKEDSNDNVWKNGPLVFEASAPEISTPIQEVATVVAPTPKKDGKLSFAEVAKTKPKVVSVPPPLAPPMKRAAVPAGSTQQEQQMRKAEDQKAAASTDDEYVSKDNTAPAVFGASGTALNVNKEFTDDLKVIGLVSVNSAGAHAEQTTSQSGGPGSIGAVSSQPLPTTEMASVEFVTGGVPPSGLGFQFEFGQFNDASNAPTANHHDPSSMHYTTQHKSTLGGANMVTSSNSNHLTSNRSQASVQQAPPSLDQFDHSAPQRNNTAGARGTSAAPSSQQPPQQHLQFQAPTTQHSQQPQQHQQQQPQQQQQQQQQQPAMFAAAQFPSYNYHPYPAMYSPLSADMRNATADQFSAATAAALAMPFPPGAFGLNGMGQMGDPLGLMLPPNLSAPPQQQQQPQAQSGQQTGAVGTTGGTPPSQNSRLAQNQLQQGPQHHQQQPQQSRPQQAGGGIDHHSSYIDSVNKTYQTQSGANLGQPNSSTNQTGSFPAMGLVVTQSSYQQPRPNMNTHGNMEPLGGNHLGGNTTGPPPGFGNIASNMNPFMQPANFQSLFQLPPNNSYPQQMAALPLLFGHGGGGQQGAGGGQQGNKYGGGGSLGGGMGGGKGGGTGQQSHYQNSLYGGGQKKQNYSGWN